MNHFPTSSRFSSCQPWSLEQKLSFRCWVKNNCNASSKHRSRHKSSKPDADSALVHAETCRLGYTTFLSQKLSLFLSLEELRRWGSGGWREEFFVVEQENKVVPFLSQSYLSYHEKFLITRIPTCEKLSKKISKALLHSASVLTCCKNMGGCHQVNKNCSKVMRHH